MKLFIPLTLASTSCSVWINPSMIEGYAACKDGAIISMVSGKRFSCEQTPSQVHRLIAKCDLDETKQMVEQFDEIFQDEKSTDDKSQDPETKRT